jgi:hypothetical protein
VYSVVIDRWEGRAHRPGISVPRHTSNSSCAASQVMQATTALAKNRTYIRLERYVVSELVRDSAVSSLEINMLRDVSRYWIDLIAAPRRKRRCLDTAETAYIDLTRMGMDIFGVSASAMMVGLIKESTAERNVAVAAPSVTTTQPGSPTRWITAVGPYWLWPSSDISYRTPGLLR